MKAKLDLKNHWEKETCGIRYAEDTDRKAYFQEITTARYSLEPYIHEFANFPDSKGKHVLEIGVGAGTDFSRWVDYAHHTTGVDLTEAAIRLTEERLKLMKVSPHKYSLLTADAERLPFPDDSFDIIYSWGVLHHSPNTERALNEVYRVLKPGGTSKIMVYHVYSWVTLILYLVHGLLKGRLFTSPRKIVFEHLESPGTKVYSLKEIKSIFNHIGFKNIKLSTKLSPGDSLSIKASEKYTSWKFKLAWILYPTRLIKLLGHRFGLYLLIEGKK